MGPAAPGPRPRGTWTAATGQVRLGQCRSRTASSPGASPAALARAPGPWRRHARASCSYGRIHRFSEGDALAAADGKWGLVNRGWPNSAPPVFCDPGPSACSPDLPLLRPFPLQARCAGRVAVTTNSACAAPIASPVFRAASPFCRFSPAAPGLKPPLSKPARSPIQFPGLRAPATSPPRKPQRGAASEAGPLSELKPRPVRPPSSSRPHFTPAPLHQGD